ncbi:MAG: hypothetical protein OXH97_10535 [Chloroflexota bacterium]|nr:hypothetical protein [Chloroflexota bacterium]
MRRWRGHLTILGVLAAAALLVGCGGSGDTGMSPTRTPTPAPTRTATPDPATSTATPTDAAAQDAANERAAELQAEAADGVVVVVGVEWAFGTALDSVPAGEVTFEMLNEGAVVHDLWVVRTDLAYDALPVEGGVAVTGGQNEVIDKVLETDAGSKVSLTVNLEPGNYALICNIPAHYQLGMRAPFTIE